MPSERSRLAKWAIRSAVLGGPALAVGILLYRVAVVVLMGSGHDPVIPPNFRVSPSVHAELAEHSKLYAKKVYKIGTHVYCAVGFGLANIIMVEGDTGIVIVDTGETIEQAEHVLAELRKITQKPIAAVVLTHHHADHVLGSSVFVSAEDAETGKVPIFAHASLVAQYAQENGLISELQSVRSMHMFGSSLAPSDRKDSNNGIGPFLSRGPTSFIPPNRTFDDQLEVTVTGVRMQLVYVPSEADSEIAVYLPDEKILLSAEVVQDHTFPNVYTIRGARHRDPVRWVASIDRLREFPSDEMVLQHGPPVHGKAEVARVLMLYRDQIQFVHDQTVRYMNKGLPPSELARIVKLPKHLADERPWGREFYGTVKHSVRNIYNGYVGWFDGDPVGLDPTPRDEYSKRLIALCGGRDKVQAAAEQALHAGDSQFAAELASLLVHARTDDMQARHLQAAAFRKLGYAQISANWRNYYLVSAMELDGQLPGVAYLQQAGSMLSSAFKGLPAASQVAALPPRLRAEATLDQDMLVGIRYLDVHDEFRLHLRRGVLEVAHTPVGDAALVFLVTRESMGALLSGIALSELQHSPRLSVVGDLAAAERFVGYFERPFTSKPEVVVR